MTPEWKQTYSGVVHPWLCDAMGHMTTRFYLAMFDDASYHYLRHIGAHAEKDHEAGIGWADIRQELDYVAEIGAGALTEVWSRPVRVGNKSMQFENELRNADTGEVSAKCLTTTVRFDLKARKGIVVEDAIRTRIEAWLTPAA